MPTFAKLNHSFSAFIIIFAIMTDYKPAFISVSIIQVFQLLSFVYITIYMMGCISPPDFPAETACEKRVFRGIFVINEGSGTNDASIFYNDIYSADICTALFEKVNSQPLGSIANALYQDKDTVYIVMDNSQCVYKIQLPTWKIIAKLSLPDQASPRHIYRVADTVAYLSSLYQEKVFIFNPITMQLSGEIPLARFQDGISGYGNQAFVACGSLLSLKNNKIAVINTLTHHLDKYISLPLTNPGQLLLKGDTLIVNCKGDYAVEKDSSGAIFFINVHNLELLYAVYIKGSIYEMAIAGNNLFAIRDVGDDIQPLGNTAIMKVDLLTGAKTDIWMRETDFKTKEAGDYIYSLDFDKEKGNLCVSFSISGKGFMTTPFKEIVGEYKTGTYPNTVFFYR